MNNTFQEYNISLEKLTEIFNETENNSYVLRPEFGEGTLRILHLEKGLRATFINCSFNRTIYLHNNISHRCDYYNLAFFSKCEGIQLTKGNKEFKEIPLWDAGLIPSSTIINMWVIPAERVECLGISFPHEWIETNFPGWSKSIPYFKEKLNALHADPLLVSMTTIDKKGIAELLVNTANKKISPLYIKSIVLAIISDFFKKLESKELVFSCNGSEQMKDTLSNLLSTISNGSRKDIKTLAAHFAVSESTIKRHFKKQYGTTISVYKLKRKAAALQLTPENNCNSTSN